MYRCQIEGGCQNDYFTYVGDQTSFVNRNEFILNHGRYLERNPELLLEFAFPKFCEAFCDVDNVEDPLPRLVGTLLFAKLPPLISLR